MHVCLRFLLTLACCYCCCRNGCPSFVALAADGNGNEEPPNVIFLFADDLGFGDLGCYGHPYALTPNLDRMAQQGTLFKHFHVTGNVCHPSRAGLMTGRNPTTFPNYTPDFGFRNASTITKLLQQHANYTTAHIGKWHIGPDPEKDAVEYGISDVRIIGSSRRDPRGREGLRFDETLLFLEQYQNQSFYLNLWVWTPHSPIEPPDELLEPFADLVVQREDFGFHMQEKFDDVGDATAINRAMRTYLAEVYAFDVQVGRMLDKLDELDLTNKTIVVFSSDNGPERQKVGPQYLGYSGGLRGEKHSFYEGGTRVPFIIRWPGKVPAGRVNNQSVTSGLDWLPTICKLAGVNDSLIPWDRVDGEDVSDIWMGSSRSRTNPLFFRDWKSKREKAMRYGRWKLFQEGRTTRELYDLSTDPEERVNLFETLPDVAGPMTETYAIWESTLPEGHARLPADPLPFDPELPLVIVGPPEELVVPAPTVPPSATLSPQVDDSSSTGSDGKTCEEAVAAYATCFEANRDVCNGACASLRQFDSTMNECDTIDALWCDFSTCCCPEEGRIYYECLLPDVCTSSCDWDTDSEAEAVVDGSEPNTVTSSGPVRGGVSSVVVLLSVVIAGRMVFEEMLVVLGVVVD